VFPTDYRAGIWDQKLHPDMILLNLQLIVSQMNMHAHTCKKDKLRYDSPDELFLNMFILLEQDELAPNSRSL
jgi:hypothetical protein